MSVKRSSNFWNIRLGALGVLVLIVVLPRGVDAVACVGDCVATDGNSSITIKPSETPDSGALTEWEVDGIDHIYEQGFWLRYTTPVTPAGPEAHQSALTLDSTDVLDGEITLEYSDAFVSVVAFYSLTGGAAGSGTASLFERFTITIDAPLVDLDFFVYTDADINDSSDDETAVFDGVDTITQTDEDGVTQLAVTSISSFSHWEIATYSDILDLLEDGAATTLSDVVSPFGPDDTTHAFQYTFTNLIVEDEFVIEIYKEVLTNSIPEPTTLLLLGLGLAGLGFARRRLH